ncbi:MAG: hypothetical protein J07AB43_10410 [Candidatus Nanosalina sp. J07AB43]|nr:MAG: hypothetical protein J07AB43_10410 [Candidatus Nanosalina sp. J07AB43]
MGDDMSRGQRENLHKWGKARRLIDEDKIEIKFKSEDRYQFKIEGDSTEYTVGVDIDTGESFCPCQFKGENCSHQLAAHLFLAGIGVENDRYRQDT